MGIINITEIIKTPDSIPALPRVTGKIQRVVNISENTIQVTGEGSGNPMTIAPGKFLDFCYDGTEWLTEAESSGSSTAGSYIKQVVQNNVVDPYYYTNAPSRTSPVELVCLNTSITTLASASKIAIDMNIVGESSNNSVFMLFRVIDSVETELSVPSSPGSRSYGIATAPYDNNEASTPNPFCIQFIDTPEVPVGTTITYKLKAYSGTTIYCINRTNDDTDAGGYERTASNVRLTEFDGTPVDTSLYTGDNTAKMGYMYVRDEKTSGTHGGTSASSSWQDRTLNTIVKNSIVGASLSSNTVILPAGTYRIKGRAPSYSVNRHKLILYNHTVSAVILIGTNNYSDSNNNVANDVSVEGEITLSVESAVGLKHYTTTNVVNGLGVDSGASCGYTEVYAELEIWQVPEVLPLVPMASETGIATESEAQAGTSSSKIITPFGLRQGLNASGNAPVYACRAWVNFNGTLSSGDYRRGYGNVSSITDLGVGTYGISLITAIEDTNYSIIATCSAADSEHALDSSINYGRTTSYFTVQSIKSNVGTRDPAYFNVAVFR